MAIDSPKNDFVEKHRWLTYADDPDTVYDGSKIMDGSVTTDKLADYAVTTDKIDDESITTVKLADYAVTTDKIDDESITTDKLDDGIVTTPKLADDSVTDAKLDGAVLEMFKGNVKAFDTVADMQAATLEAGDICHTNGFHTAGDGGAAFYKVSASGTSNGMDVIACGDVFANLETGKNNPACYGADTSGTLNASNSINACFAANINGEIIFSPGVYKVESPILIDYNNYKLTVDFCGSKIVDSTDNEQTLSIGYLNKTTEHANYGTDLVNRNYTYIKNLYIESSSDWAIDVANWFTNLHLQNVSIICDNSGVRVGGRSGTETNHAIDAQFTDLYICNTNAEHANTIGIEFLGSDSKINNARIYGFQTGVKTFGGEWLDQVHFLLTMVYGTPQFDSTYRCIECHGSLKCTNVYCDTMPQFLKYVSGAWIDVDGLFIYAYSEALLEDCIIFDFENSSDNIVNLKLSNIAFYNGNYPENTIFLKSVYPFELTNPSSISLRSQEFIRLFKTGDVDVSGNYYIQDSSKMLKNANKSKDMLWIRGKEVSPHVMSTALTPDVWSYLCSIPLSFVNQYVIETNNITAPGGNTTRWLHGKFAISFNNNRNGIGSVVDLETSNINLGFKFDNMYCHVYARPNSTWASSSYTYFYPLTTTANVNLADLVSDFQYQYENAMVERYGAFYHPTGNFDYQTNS